MVHERLTNGQRTVGQNVRPVNERLTNTFTQITVNERLTNTFSWTNTLVLRTVNERLTND